MTVQASWYLKLPGEAETPNGQQRQDVIAVRSVRR